MAGFNLGDILVTIKANTDSLKQGLNDVQGMAEQTKSLGDKIKTGLNVAAGAMTVVGAGLTLYSKNALSFTEDLVKSSTSLARIIGTSTTEASRLSAAMQRMGIDADSTQQMFGIFAKKISESSASTTTNSLAVEKLQVDMEKTRNEIKTTTAEISKHGDADGSLTVKLKELAVQLKQQQDQLNQSANSFQKLGVSTIDAKGKQKDFTTILGEVSDKFKEMPNGVNKTALALDLFGRSGKDMLKVLNLGSDGIAQLEQQADKLGLTLNANTIGKINDLIQAQKDLKQQTDALKITVGTEVAPVMTSFNKALNDMLRRFLDSKGPVHDATVGILAFGGPILTAAGATLAFVANATQAAPALAKMAMALRDSAAAQWVLNIAMDANPIILLIGAIVALTGAFIWMLFNMQQTGAFMVSLTDWFGQSWHPAILGAIDVLMPFIGLPLTIITYWSPIVGFFTGLWDFVTGLFSSHWQTILAIVVGVIFPLAGIIIGNFQSVVGVISWALDAIGGIVSAIGGWFARLPGYVASGVAGAVAYAASLPGRIAGAVGNLGGLLANAGESVMDGFLNALKGGFKKVQDFVTSIASWIKAHKGPVEDDKKLLIPAGGAIMKGLRAGLTDEWKNVQGFIGDIGANLAGGILAPVGAAQHGQQITDNSRRSTTIGQVIVNDRPTADYLLDRLDRDHQLESMGGSPAR